MDRIGLIGVGNIGRYYSQRLREVGYALTVFDKDEKRMEPALALGAKAAKSPGEVAESSGIILFCLPGSPAVENVMEGADGILNHLKAGQLIIDTGTTHPHTDIKYEKLCAEKGAGFLDAPITWRSPGLIIMVGGSPENFERGQEVLNHLSYKLKHIGPIGQGQVVKLMNQLLLAGQLAVYAETIEWGKKSGVDPRLLQNFLEFAVDESLYGDNFRSGGELALHYKDLGYVLDLAHFNGANIPITEVVHEIFKAVKNLGEPDWGQPGIVTYWRRLNNA